MTTIDLSKISTPPHLGYIPTKVISLVPSITESICELGFADSLIGITDYCIYPADKVNNIPKIGGTKNPDLQKIIEMAPQLIIANQEENTDETIRELIDNDINVWVSFPKSVDDALDVLRKLLGLFKSDSAAMQINSLQMAYDWARDASIDVKEVNYFCPIWQDDSGETKWWMTFNEETYSNDLLSTFALKNIFAKRTRKYPLDAELGKVREQENVEGDTRYPRVSNDEIILADPQLIILPSEPFPFTIENKLEIIKLFSETSAVKNDRVIVIDGSLITWHGTRLAKAISQLPELLTVGYN